MSTDRRWNLAASVRQRGRAVAPSGAADVARRLVGTGLLLVIALTAAASGCARVLPIERELLSEPIMELDNDARGRAAEQHWLETLEASTGGYGGAAGGCACY